MHVRSARTSATTYDFTYDGESLEGIENYKYLGYWLYCNLNVKTMTDSMMKSGERALGAIIGKIKKNGDVGYLMFATLYRTCVTPVIDYCSGIWGIYKGDQKKLTPLNKVQQRA